MSVTDAPVRLLTSALRRYTRDPSTRKVSALHMLRNAARILASETSPGDAALAAAEVLSEIAQQDRRDAA